MPRLPDVRSVQPVAFSGTKAVARVDTSNIGAGERALGAGLNQIEQRRAEYQSSKARTDFLKSYTKEVNSYDERPDFENFDDDFQTNSTEALNKAAERITDMRERQRFLDNGMLKIAEGAERIRDLSFRKETDYERSTVQDDLTQLQDTAFIAANEDVLDITEAVTSRLDSAVQAGYITNQEKVKQLTTWKQTVAANRIDALPVEKRKEALEQPWAQNIPAHIRAKIAQDAEIETLERDAIETVDDMLDRGLDRTDAMIEMREIDDEDLRMETERRFDYQFNKQQVAEQEQQNTLYEEYATSLLEEPEFNIDNIPSSEWDKMSLPVKQNLMKLDEQKFKPRSTSDPQALIDLAALNAAGDFVAMSKYMSENSALFSAKDQVKYGEAIIEGVMPIEVNDNLTDVQSINAKLVEAGINDKNAKDKMLNKIGEWRRGYIERNNKMPDDAERAQFIDDMLIEVVTDDGYIWDSTQTLFEMDDNDWNNAVEVMSDSNPEALQSVLDYYRENGVEPTRAEVVKAYEQFIEAKNNG